MALGLPGEWPLVGRVPELDRVRGLLAGTEVAGVVLAGPPGVGKTRLALECLDQAERAGFATATATATRAASFLPFGALAPLLPPMQRGELKHADDPSELLRHSAAALLEQAGDQPLLLFVDDAHLLDDTSAVLVHQLASTKAARILATLRNEISAPDPIVALWKEGILERLTIGRLNSQAIDEALCSALGGPVDQAAVDLLAVRCQGNMLFLRELVQGAFEDGSLHNDGGIWRLIGPLSPSARLIELVQARLGNLEESERTVLEIVSFGEPLGPAELNALADPGMIDRLERRGLLSTRENSRRLDIRLAHPLSGDVLRAGIPGLRARAIARSLAEAVEATGARRREDTLRVATWRLDGGGANPQLMLAGAIMARRYSDFPLAERLARAAVDSGAGFDAALLAAQLASLQGRPDEAEAELLTLAASAADDRQRGLVAITRIDHYLYQQGRIEDGSLVADEFETIKDPAWRDEIMARWSSVLFSTRGPKAVLEAVEPLLQRTDSPSTVYACWVASHALIRFGRLDAAVDTADRGRASVGSLPWPSASIQGLHVILRCDALTLAGRIIEAEALAHDHYQRSLAERSPEGQAFLAWAMSKAALSRGRLQTAARYGREAVALCKQLGWPYIESLCFPHLTIALALSGQAAEAVAALAVLDGLGLQATLVNGTDALEARAWAAVASGDLRLARIMLEEAATLGESIGDNIGAVAALHDLARLGRARSILPRLTSIANGIEGEFTHARLAHTRGLADRDASALERVSATFESMGADLLAAEAAAEAASIWRDQGRQRDAAAAEHRAGGLADLCEGATTPALQAVEGRARLSPAERHAALLAADGRSNKEIARELQLSVRTVETYLYRVYEKLGISGRDQLAETLLPPRR